MAKSGSRSGMPTLMSTVTLCCLTISLAACKSVVLGDQMSKPRIKEVMLPPEDSKASKLFPGLLAAYDWK
ncbi:Mesogenin-1 [Manis pentadactyla]|nr:Mesogenin-1 [Manis pentadactyla]